MLVTVCYTKLKLLRYANNEDARQAPKRTRPADGAVRCEIFAIDSAYYNYAKISTHGMRTVFKRLIERIF